MVSFKVLAALILSSAVMAAPSPLASRADDNCAPEMYTLSDFSLVTSATAAYVNFNLKSTFANDTSIIDAVINGVDCGAEGPSIPNNNECRTPDRKLLFDLRGPEDQAYYQITHTWTCNSATWMSGNAVKVDPLNCKDDGVTRACSGGPQEITPQNVRKICSTPRC